MAESVHLDSESKSSRTRSHILETSLSMFARNGYHNTTMRDIASASECSLGLTYRYFRSKDDLVMAYYEDIAHELRAQVSGFEPSTIAVRYSRHLRSTFRRLSTLREAFGSIAGTALNPYSGSCVLGKKYHQHREIGWNTVRAVIAGARDAPASRETQTLSTLLYCLQSLVILFWVNDSSENQASTATLVSFIEESIVRLRPLLRTGVFYKSASTLAQVLLPMFGPV